MNWLSKHAACTCSPSATPMTWVRTPGVLWDGPSSRLLPYRSSSILVREVIRFTCPLRKLYLRLGLLLSRLFLRGSKEWGLKLWKVQKREHWRNVKWTWFASLPKLWLRVFIEIRTIIFKLRQITNPRIIIFHRLINPNIRLNQKHKQTSQALRKTCLWDSETPNSPWAATSLGKLIQNYVLISSSR
jgi:hypothetical protein